METLSEFESWIRSAIDAAAARLAEQKETAQDSLEAKILNYLQEHRFSDITLESLADHVGFSPNYVSKLFRSITGTTFTDYITDLKMQQACLLLQEGRHHVQEIAVQLGYASTSHFINVFKRKIGCTPKQYQKQHQLGQSS